MMCFARHELRIEENLSRVRHATFSVCRASYDDDNDSDNDCKHLRQSQVGPLECSLEKYPMPTSR